MNRPLTLELAEGFEAVAFENIEEQNVFVDATLRDPIAKVILTDASASRTRALAQLPGRIVPAGAITASRLRRKVYVAGEAGIWEFPFERGEPTLVAGLPDLPNASLDEVRQAYGWDAPFRPEKIGVPGYSWLLQLDESSGHLFALCGQEGTLNHIVQISLDSRGFTSSAPIPMPGFCAGIRADSHHGIIVLPCLKDGPQILDLKGNRLAAASDVVAAAGRSFSHASIRPTDGAVVLSEYEGGLWQWKWKEGEFTNIVDDGACPTYSPDSTIFFRRTCADLWMLKRGAEPKMLATGLGNHGGTEFQRRHGWLSSPRVSRDGRYVQTNFVVIRKTNTAEVADHAVVTVDLTDRRVHQVPGHWHTSTWF